MRPAKEFQPSFWYPEELGHCFWPIHYVVKVLAGPGQIRDQILGIWVEVDKQKAAVVFHARGLEPAFLENLLLLEFEDLRRRHRQAIVSKEPLLGFIVDQIFDFQSSLRDHGFSFLCS